VKRLPTGRLFAYIGVCVGLGISIAANFAHATAHKGAPSWAPYLSASWPLLLFLALEILTRVQWSGRGVWVARAGVAVVAVVAASLSYSHLRDLLIHQAGEAVWAATIGPLAIDGIMAISAAALLTTSSGAIHGPVTRLDAVADPAQGAPGAAQEAHQGMPEDRTTEPDHRTTPQVTASQAVQERPKTPVSQDAIDRVLLAVRSGQPMGKSAIVQASGLSPSTATRAVGHLVEVGQLRTLGEPHRPSYVLATSDAEAAQ